MSPVPTTTKIDTGLRLQFSLRALLAATAVCGLILTLLVNNLTAWAVECLIILGFFLLSYLTSCHFGANRSAQDREAYALQIMAFGVMPAAVWCALDKCLVGGFMFLMIATAIGFGQFIAPRSTTNGESTPIAFPRARVLVFSTSFMILSTWLLLRIGENSHRVAIESHVKKINAMRGVRCYRAFGPSQPGCSDPSRRYVTESSAIVWWGPVPMYRFPTFRVYAHWPKYFGDEDLVEVARLDCIRELNLCDTRITDAGLAHLKPLHNLDSLDVTGTRITQAALDDLRRALPPT